VTNILRPNFSRLFRIFFGQGGAKPSDVVVVGPVKVVVEDGCVVVVVVLMW
jgi:hypothetical protein